MISLLALTCFSLSVYGALSDEQYASGGPSQVTLDLLGRHRPAITPEFSDYADAMRKKYGVQGLSVGVVHLNGQDVHTEYGTWGVRTEDGDLTTSDTLFQIGSCSKAFLAAAMGILMDDFAQGKNVTALPPGLESFTWDTKVHELLQGDYEWKLVDPWATEKANFKDVLSHVSGIPGYLFSNRLTDTPLDVVKRLRFLKPTYELRQQFQYSNQMYVLGVHVINKYSGATFTSFVEERIFKPLNMSSTTYFVDEGIQSGNMSQAFIAPSRRIPYHLADRDVSELIAGAGSVISSAVDMSKWVAMLLNNGISPHTQETVVPRHVLDIITWAYSIMAGQAPSAKTSIYGYGMGWLRYTYRGYEVVGHAGGLPGFISFTAFLPWESFGLVVLINNASPEAEILLSSVVERIIETVLGLPHQQRTELTLSSMTAFPLTFNVMPEIHGIANPPPPSASLLTAEKSALPLSVYEGTYTNPIYGTFTICSPLSTSSHCWHVLSTFRPVTPRTAIPGLYAEWPTVWTKHLRFTPRSEYNFGVEVITVQPDGYGENRTFVYSALPRAYTFRAEFDVDDAGDEPTVKGFVLPGGFELPEVFLGSGIPLEKLQIYFEKV